MTIERVAPKATVMVAPVIVPALVGVLGADNWTADEDRWTGEGGAQPGERFMSSFPPATVLRVHRAATAAPREEVATA